MKYVEISNECWNWTGHLIKGYGSFYMNGKDFVAHRASYILFSDDTLDPNLVLDHLCRNRSCVNPDHVEQVTRGENTLRGLTLTAFNLKKTHCPIGHELQGTNLYLHKGQRHCRSCGREHMKKYRIKKKLCRQPNAL